MGRAAPHALKVSTQPKVAMVMTLATSPVPVAATDRTARQLAARQMLGHCEMCAFRCGANRLAGETGPCRLTSETRVFRQYVSLLEEAEAAPALRVFLAGCNFRCGFCDTAPDCFDPNRGTRLVAKQAAAEWRGAIQAGCRTISVLGGEPTLHVHTLLDVQAAAGEPLPLAINTNLYLTPETLALLAGDVALYLADFKFGNDACAHRIAGVPNYLAVVRQNLRAIHDQTPLVVRHVLLPGHLECCFKPIVEWLNAELPGVRFQLYPGFVPCFRAASVGLGRLNARTDVQAAIECLQRSQLNWSAGTHDPANH